VTKKQVRDDLASAIGAVTEVSSRSITPTAVWVPDIGSRSDIDAPIIQVAPVRLKKALVGRRVQHDTHTMQAAIVEPLGSDPDTTADTAQAMAEAIAADILGTKFESAGATCVEVEEIVAAAADQWREKRLFVTVLQFTLK
jgi:hypothetical protein